MKILHQLKLLCLPEMKNIIQTSLIKKVNLLAHVTEYCFWFKWSLIQGSNSVTKDLISLISIFSIGSKLRQALSSCSRYGCVHCSRDYLPLGSNLEPSFLAGLDWITVAREIGYTRWQRPRSHVSPWGKGEGIGVVTSLFSPSPWTESNHSPPQTEYG